MAATIFTHTAQSTTSLGLNLYDNFFAISLQFKNCWHDMILFGCVLFSCLFPKFILCTACVCECRYWLFSLKSSGLKAKLEEFPGVSVLKVCPPSGQNISYWSCLLSVLYFCQKQYSVALGKSQLYPDLHFWQWSHASEFYITHLCCVHKRPSPTWANINKYVHWPGVYFMQENPPKKGSSGSLNNSKIPG